MTFEGAHVGALRAGAKLSGVDPFRQNIEELLEDARTIGTLDSQGSFTIAGDAALGKLAGFQLPRPSAWILKLVQAAVALGAEALEVKQGNENTHFFFSPRDSLNMRALKQLLLSPQLAGSPALEHLAVGLRAVGFGDRRAFNLIVEQDEQRTIISWNGSELKESADRSEVSSQRSVQLLVAFPPEDKGRRLLGLSKSAGRATDEYLEVARNAEVCPIPLTFDGRRLDCLAAPPAEGVGHTIALSVGWVPASGTEPGLMRLPSGVFDAARQNKFGDRFTDNRVFHLDGPEGESEVRSISKLSYRYRIKARGEKFDFDALKLPSEYAWVKHGVVCHRQPSRYEALPVGFQIYLCADDLPTDISGLTIRSTEESQERINQARERLLFQVENTIEALNSHVPRPFMGDAIIGGALSAFCLLAGPFTFGKSLFGSFCSAGYIASSAAKKKQLMNDCRMYLKKLGDRLRFPER